MQDTTKELLEFIHQCPTMFHAAANCIERLRQNGFMELLEKDTWLLKKNSKYFVQRNSSSVIAFVTGNGDIVTDGVRGICAHTDSPSFKIKPNPEIPEKKGLVTLNTETYGGAIASSWFDKPLSIAGRLFVKNSQGRPKEILLNCKKPILVIPNLAIHMNRKINDGYTYNAQTDMLPVAGFVSKTLTEKELLFSILSKEISVDKEDIIDFELFLYDTQIGCIAGHDDDLISSSRLDNLWMVFAGLTALLKNTEQTAHTRLFCAFDNEEVGSRTMQGAGSFFLRDTLKRICIGLDKPEDGFYRAMSADMSAFISADLAHGLHPNYKNKHDPTNQPLLGGGPVIKYSSNQRYATTAYSSAVFKASCEKANIPYQTFVNRSDTIGGSTIGTIVASSLGVPVVDVGAAILAMHSIRELGAVCDNDYTINAFTAFLK